MYGISKVIIYCYCIVFTLNKHVPINMSNTEVNYIFLIIVTATITCSIVRCKTS